MAQAEITFAINFTAAANEQYSAAEIQAFNDGLDFWDNVIDGHQDNVDRTFTLTVDAFSEAATVTDLPGGGTSTSITLGSAGPGDIALTNAVAGIPQSFERYVVATTGLANFNTHADAGALRADVILHEIGHSLGIGTLWEANEVHNDGDPNNNITFTDGEGNVLAVRTGSAPTGQYNGAFGLAAYQAEFDALATFIPIEQGGGSGTANGHWNEVDGGIALTGITDGDGNDFRNELMTGWAAPTEADAFVSNTTIQSLLDLGFTLETVPEPSSIMLLALSSIGFITRRRR